MLFPRNIMLDENTLRPYAAAHLCTCNSFCISGSAPWKQAQKHLVRLGLVQAQLSRITCCLAYGGGSIKRNGVYDEVCRSLRDAGKTVFEFSGILPNPTCAKVPEGAKLARRNRIDRILAVGGAASWSAAKPSAWRQPTGALWADF